MSERWTVTSLSEEQQETRDEVVDKRGTNNSEVGKALIGVMDDINLRDYPNGVSDEVAAIEHALEAYNADDDGDEEVTAETYDPTATRSTVLSSSEVLDILSSSGEAEINPEHVNKTSKPQSAAQAREMIVAMLRYKYAKVSKQTVKNYVKQYWGSSEHIIRESNQPRKIRDEELYRERGGKKYYTRRSSFEADIDDWKADIKAERTEIVQGYHQKAMERGKGRAADKYALQITELAEKSQALKSKCVRLGVREEEMQNFHNNGVKRYEVEIHANVPASEAMSRDYIVSNANSTWEEMQDKGIDPIVSDSTLEE